MAYRVGIAAGLAHALDVEDTPLCDEDSDEDITVTPGATWPPASGIACPACQQVTSARGGA